MVEDMLTRDSSRLCENCTTEYDTDAQTYPEASACESVRLSSLWLLFCSLSKLVDIIFASDTTFVHDD